MSEVVTRREIVAGEKAILESLNDTDRARDAADALRHDLMFVPGLGWHSWDGKRWSRIGDDEAFGIVQAWHWEFSRECLMNLPTKDLAAFLSVGAVRATVAGLKPLLLKHADELDAHPHLLNVANGVIDLRTGELAPHDRDLLITLIADVDYKPDATHPDLDLTLKALPKKARERMRIRLGQSATGYTPDDDIVTVVNGGGENGKSTLLDAVRNVLGEYAAIMPDKLLLANPGDHPAALMALRGVRFAEVEELPEGHRLNTKRLKDIAGTESITARRMHQDFVTFRTTHTMFVTTNYLPIITETDEGTWRRLELITFPYHYVKGEPAHPNERTGIRGLRPRMQRGKGGRAEAMLAWLVSGARDWFEADRITANLPARLEADKRAWRKETDAVLRFVDECLELAPDGFTPSRDLYALFSGWQDANGLGKWSVQTFSARIAQHDELLGRVELVKRRSARGWQGVRIADRAAEDIRFASIAATLANHPVSTVTTD